jgi:hypothetical protein
MVADIERWTVTGAEHITYCSADDWRMMGDNWAHDMPPGTHIPNGTHLPDTTANGHNLNLIFIGSNYGPNIKAAQRLIDLASLLPEYHIHIVGRCTDQLTTDATNVTLHGYKTEQALDRIMAMSHVFVNLVTEGSGTHLKVAKALAYGLPVVTLPAGSRGYYDNVIISSLADIPETVRAVTKSWQRYHTEALGAAQQYNWATIRPQYAEAIHALQ